MLTEIPNSERHEKVQQINIASSINHCTLLSECNKPAISNTVNDVHAPLDLCQNEDVLKSVVTVSTMRTGLRHSSSWRRLVIKEHLAFKFQVQEERNLVGLLV
jgi:hypothetical protein